MTQYKYTKIPFDSTLDIINFLNEQGERGLKFVMFIQEPSSRLTLTDQPIIAAVFEQSFEQTVITKAN